MHFSVNALYDSDYENDSDGEDDETQIEFVEFTQACDFTKSIHF